MSGAKIGPSTQKHWRGAKRGQSTRGLEDKGRFRRRAQNKVLQGTLSNRRSEYIQAQTDTEVERLDVHR